VGIVPDIETVKFDKCDLSVFMKVSMKIYVCNVKMFGLWQFNNFSEESASSSFWVVYLHG